MMRRERDDEGPLLPEEGEGARGLRGGWALPLELDERGEMPRERPSPLVSTAKLILEIVPGERRREPGFGCRIHHLPSLAGEEDRQLAAALIEESLERWAPALRVDRAEVLRVEDGRIDVALRARGSWHSLTITHRDARVGRTSGAFRPGPGENPGASRPGPGRDPGASRPGPGRDPGASRPGPQSHPAHDELPREGTLVEGSREAAS